MPKQALDCLKMTSVFVKIQLQKQFFGLKFSFTTIAFY